MGWASGIAVFVMTWWIVIFMVLPWGISHDPTTGQVGAPLKAQLFKKALITTGLTIIIWLIIYYITAQADLFSFRDMARDMPLQ